MSNEVKTKTEKELCEGCDPETTLATEIKAIQDEQNVVEEEVNKEVAASVKEECASKDSDEEDSDEEELEEVEEAFDMSKSMNEIFSGQDLTEEFKLKVSTLFEAAVNTRVKLVEGQLANKFTQLLESEVEDIANNLTEKVDSYLNYVVNEWMEENKLVVEKGIRTDVAESFITGLQNLFTEHNISVPEGKTDLLDETTNNLQKATEQLNNQIKKTVDLTEQLKKYERAEMFALVTEGLSSIQVEKLRELAEGMKFSDNGEFKAKLQILKDNFTKVITKPTVSSIQVEDTSEPTTLNEEAPADVSAYLKAMLRKNV